VIKIQIVISFGFGDYNYEKNKKIAMDILSMIRDKTGYCGWVEDDSGNIIKRVS